MKIVIFLVVFFLLGAFFIISNENIALNSEENLEIFFSEYLDWTGGLLENGGRVAGYVVKMEWLPEN